jgi:hypothetical protein
MKRILAILSVLLSVTVHNTFAQDNGFGIGIMIGEPTGISAKYWLNNVNAYDFGLAYSFLGKHSALSIHADYLYHDDIINSEYRFPLYYGFGGRLRFVNGEENAFGARGIIGIAFLNDNLPIDIFFEIVPVFNLFPKTSLDLDISLGIRYFP